METEKLPTYNVKRNWIQQVNENYSTKLENSQVLGYDCNVRSFNGPRACTRERHQTVNVYKQMLAHHNDRSDAEDAGDGESYHYHAGALSSRLTALTFVAVHWLSTDRVIDNYVLRTNRFRRFG